MSQKRDRFRIGYKKQKSRDLYDIYNSGQIEMFYEISIGSQLQKSTESLDPSCSLADLIPATLTTVMQFIVNKINKEKINFFEEKDVKTNCFVTRSNAIIHI